MISLEEERFVFFVALRAFVKNVIGVRTSLPHVTDGV